MSTGCVICDIVANSIPSWIIFQDANVVCFLPKKLEANGHTIVASKAHFSDIYSSPELLLQTLITTTKKLAIHYKDKIGSTGINLLHASGLSAQQSIQHLHFHLIPRFENDGLNAWPNLSSKEYDKDEILKILKIQS